jgi:hypothetical protein
MLMILDDFDLPDTRRTPDEKPSAPSPAPPTEPPLRFTVSEGAGRYVGLWLVILGIMGVLAGVALIGFGPR